MQTELHPNGALDPELLAAIRAAFEQRVRRNGGPHLRWTGDVHRSGWPRISLFGRAWSAARISWLLERGTMPVGQVRRTCGVPDCVSVLCLTETKGRRRARTPVARRQRPLSPTKANL